MIQDCEWQQDSCTQPNWTIQTFTLPQQTSKLGILGALKPPGYECQYMCTSFIWRNTRKQHTGCGRQSNLFMRYIYIMPYVWVSNQSLSKMLREDKHSCDGNNISVYSKLRQIRPWKFKQEIQIQIQIPRTVTWQIASRKLVNCWDMATYDERKPSTSSTFCALNPHPHPHPFL
jgi:hypothetical protein